MGYELRGIEMILSYGACIGILATSVVFLLLESVYIFYKWTSRTQGYLFLSCIAIFVNNAAYLLGMNAHSEYEYMIALKLSYMGRVWIPFSMFLFIMTMCKVYISKKIYVCLSFVHMFIWGLVLTCEHHQLYYTHREFVIDGMFPHVNAGHGIVYNMYMVLMLSYIFIGLITLFKKTITENDKTAKARCSTVLAAVLLESAFYVMEMCGVAGYFDVTTIGYAFATIFMYIAIFKYDLLDTLQKAKDYVTDELLEAIIVIEPSGSLLYFNKRTLQIFPDIETNTAARIEEIKRHIESDEPISIGGKFYSPQEESLQQNGFASSTIYMLVDDTSHYNYMAELKEQKELAEAANASKSSFLSIVSHEIRTPMNAIVGMTDLMLREKDSLTEKQTKYLSNIKNSGAALVMIVNDILDQSKIEAGKMEIIEQPYELRPMIEDVKMIIEERIGTKPIHVIYEIDEEVPQYLLGDSLRIRQIIINLMNNAVKFTEEGFIKLTIEVKELESKKRYLRFGIKDSGQGIRPEDLDKLGQAFTQVDTKKNHNKEGTGLGLSISRDFVSMMGGQLEVTSEYGKGSEFFFSIWQGVASGIDNNTSGISKQAWQQEENFTAPGVKVLFVDDTPINLMIAEEMLSPLKMDVSTSTTAERAIAMVKKVKYDIIFMDYMMPTMDGVEATKIIRNLAVEEENAGNSQMAEYFRKVPVIALTGDASDDTKNRFMMAGIDDFAEKPISLPNLKKILIKWVSKEKIEKA